MRRRSLFLSLCLALGCGRGSPEPSSSARPEPTTAAAPASSPATGDAPPSTPLPGRSVYQLGSTFTDQHGRPFELGSTRGHPTVVLLFYGTCEAACPILIEDVMHVDEALPADVRANVRYTLVSFDPENDTPERLLALAREKHMDDARYRLVTGRPSDILSLAVVLGVQFTKRGEGDFSHSNVITLLDRDGVIATKLDGLHQPNETFVARAAELAR